MVVAFNIALSGLAAADKRLQTAANNIANVSSTKSLVNGQAVDQPYIPQRVDQVSLSHGGVLSQTSDAANPFITVPDLDNLQNTVQLPNVDIGQELVNLKIASYDFKANLKTIQVQDNLNDTLLDIIS